MWCGVAPPTCQRNHDHASSMRTSWSKSKLDPDYHCHRHQRCLFQLTFHLGPRALLPAEAAPIFRTISLPKPIYTISFLPNPKSHHFWQTMLTKSLLEDHLAVRSHLLENICQPPPLLRTATRGHHLHQTLKIQLFLRTISSK